MATRKTAKYYREELVKNNQPCSVMVNLISEICKKYGDDRQLYIERTKYNWNHCLKGFELNKSGKLLVQVYWQGDDTDGEYFIPFVDLYQYGRKTIPSRSFYDGYRTRYEHSDIKVEKSELIELIGNLSAWLAPSAIKMRKVEKEIREVTSVISKLLGNDYCQKYNRGHGLSPKYTNAKSKTMEWVRSLGADVLKMDMETLKKEVDKIFIMNYK